jgi:hypothetical protein
MTDKQLNKYIFLAVVGFGAYYFWTKNKRLNEFDERELALMEEEADRKAKADKPKKKKKSKGYKIKPIKKKKATTPTPTPATETSMTMGNSMSSSESMSMGSSMASSNEPITPENAPTEQANENAPTQEEENTQSFVDGEKDNDGWTIGAEPSQPYIVNVGSMPQPMMNMDGQGDLVVNDKPSAPDSRDSANGKWNNEVLFGFDDGIEDVDEFYEDFGDDYEEAYDEYMDEEDDYDYLNRGHDPRKDFDNKSKLNFDLDDTIY